MPADVSYNSQEGTTDYKSLPSITFDYDRNTASFTCPKNGFMANYGFRLIDLEMQVKMKPAFRPWTETVARPKNPVFSVLIDTMRSIAL